MARRSDHTRDELHALALEAARAIVRKEGIGRLTARAVAAGIGYTVGTVYQVFRNMDDMVEQLNAGTLDRLYETCTETPLEGDVGERLMTLAAAFVRFAGESREEFNAVISYQFAPGHEYSDAYNARIERLLGLMMAATAGLYGPGEEARHLHDMRVLWISLYGMFSLDAAGRLGAEETVAGMARTLVDFYLASRG